MKLYRIVNWDADYENNRTRKMKSMQWVPVRNKHDGDGYIQLVSCPDGAAMLGAWLAILQVASKCATRGTLLRSSGQPHDAQSIAAICRLDAKVIAKALELCSSIDVGWIEVVDTKQHKADCHSSRTLGAPSAHPVDEEGIEEKRMEGKKEPPNPQGGVDPDGITALPLDKPATLAKAPAPRPARPRDEIWDTVAELFYGGTVAEPHARAVGRIVRDLKALNATPREIRERLLRMQTAWPTLTLTGTALVKHWVTFAGASPPTPTNNDVHTPEEIRAFFGEDADAVAVGK